MNRRDSKGAQAGFTLTELLVSMVLLLIVSGMLITSVVAIDRAVMKDQAAGANLDIARVGMNRMTNNVRAGMEIQQLSGPNLPAFAAIAPESLTVYASLGAVPTKVTYSVDSQRRLIETKVPGTANSGPYWTFTATPVVTIVGSQIPAGTASPLFTFNDSTGAPLTVQTSTDSTVLSTIKSVTISLTVNTNPAQGFANTTLTNAVVLPNLGVAKR